MAVHGQVHVQRVLRHVKPCQCSNEFGSVPRCQCRNEFIINTGHLYFSSLVYMFHSDSFVFFVKKS